jgi:hypothetical protein
MRAALIAILASCPAWAGTVIQETAIIGPNGAPATGTVEIAASAPFVAADGVRVETRTDTIHVVNGRLTVTLEPNDTATPPNTQYVATWKLDGGRPRAERWTVPTSLVALRVQDVAAAAVQPSLSIAWQQMAQNGAAVGQAPLWSGTSWIPSTVSSGGGNSINVVPCSASPTFDLALGNMQAMQLTCNVTSASVLHLAPNTVAMFTICQAPTGGPYGFAWPAAVVGGVAVGAAAGKCSAQWFYSSDGTYLRALGLGVVNQ